MAKVIVGQVLGKIRVALDTGDLSIEVDSDGNGYQTAHALAPFAKSALRQKLTKLRLRVLAYILDGRRDCVSCSILHDLAKQTAVERDILAKELAATTSLIAGVIDRFSDIHEDRLRIATSKAAKDLDAMKSVQMRMNGRVT